MCGEYMALSYCWGDPKIHQVLKTLHSNVELYKERIPFQSLPLTLQHAVTLARRLNLRYLWVDALCIIQDDQEDWRSEAAKMCDLYTNATITAIACRADGSSGGIFGPQEYSSYTLVPYKQTYVGVSEDYARDHDSDVLALQRTNPDPVHTRAWKLQEAVLSNRAIYFTSQEMRWECNSCRHCQCGQKSQRYSDSLNDEDLAYELYRRWRLDDFFTATTVAEAYEQWSWMVVMYTSRAITVDDDRLLALGGLARRFAEIMKARFGREERYLAGMWLGSLPRELLWYTQFRGLSVVKNRHYARPEVWRAPSWSWASMEADVDRHQFRDLQSRVEVLEASTQLAGPDPFGPVKEGPLNYLRISGPMLRDIRFNYNKYPEDEGPVSLRRRCPTVCYQGHELRQASVSPDEDLDEVTDSILLDEHQAFAMLVVGYSPGGDVHEVLVLRPVKDAEATFERFAMARLGPHLREPKENRRAIESAPCHRITLI